MFPSGNTSETYKVLIARWKKIDDEICFFYLGQTHFSIIDVEGNDIPFWMSVDSFPGQINILIANRNKPVKFIGLL